MACAAPFDVRSDDWEGLSQFVRAAEVELGVGRVVLASTLDLHLLRPDDALVLVHPTRALDVDELSNFMHAGGRVVLLDDYGSGEDLLTLFHIRRIPLPEQPNATLRDNPALAIAEPGAGHPVVAGVAHVVTNHATGLENPSLSSVLVVHGSTPGTDVVFALAGTVGKGRLLAAGDASVVMNSMLRYPGNRAFAMGLVRYAVEDDRSPSGDRREAGKLYILTNDFETTGSFGDGSPFWAALSEARRSLVDAMEATRRGGMPPAAAYLVAVLVAVGVLAWTGARAGKTHKLTVPRFTRAIPVVAQGGIAGHAAVLGAPGTSRALAVLELKSALEEELATRLGLQRAPSPDQLVARLRAMRLADDASARALLRVFAQMTNVEAKVAQGARQGAGGLAGLPQLRAAPSDAEVLTLAAAVRELRAKLGLTGAPAPAPSPAAGRGNVEEPL
ncbi:MAG TPA: DUF4350 domain-containing protein [Polyangiaceae bacterium]|nr:DUF4350 domain-containing protein [Polyangiaceae bacterium]